MGTEHVSMRLDSELAREIKEIATRQGRSTSYVIKRLIEEGLRMHCHPGIIFTDAPGGRRTVVAGTGLAVFEVVQLWLSCRKKNERVLELLSHINRTQLEAALSYYRAYQREIEQEIKENSLSVRDILKRYPFIKVVKV